MKFTAFIFFFVLLMHASIFSQVWSQLPLSDTADGRYEDMYFVNENTGIIISYSGRINKTTNGGINWFTVHDDLNSGLRSTGFFDTATGIVGTLDSNNVLFRTTNGGLNFINITANIQGTIPKGICGISIVNQSTAYACGRYNCPANVLKTTNAGLNWISLPVDTSLVRSLVDCYFWSADSGFVVGGYAANNIFDQGRSVILRTVNGGMNWTQVYRSTRSSEWCWKIQFVNRQLGFSSIEKYNAPTFILKTTNVGINWIEIALPSNITNLEGIGFLNEQTGWVGGWGSNFNMPCYRTTNGGINWHLAGWGKNVNRFRFLNDTTAYSVGKSVYKYDHTTIGIQQISTETPKAFTIHQSYPNPFNPSTKIKFEIPKSSFVTIKLYNALGKEITTLANENLSAGIYSVNWDASAYPSGIYFYKIISGNFSGSKKMILIK
jgi:photosystem II stability/assembly factor-like uncharacterized protein